MGLKESQEVSKVKIKKSELKKLVEEVLEESTAEQSKESVALEHIANIVQTSKELEKAMRKDIRNRGLRKKLNLLSGKVKNLERWMDTHI